MIGGGATFLTWLPVLVTLEQAAIALLVRAVIQRVRRGNGGVKSLAGCGVQGSGKREVTCRPR